MVERPPRLFRSDSPFFVLFRFAFFAVSFSHPSPINDILDKETFTLVEILAQDEVLQETKSLNIKLVELWDCLVMQYVCLCWVVAIGTINKELKVLL